MPKLRDPKQIVDRIYDRGQRAKRRGLARNAAVVLGNVGTNEDADVLTAPLDDAEPLERGHTAWALS